MELTGFTEEQLTVRDAIQKICSQFSNEYWQQHDETETDPKELHAALAADGWLGIALPEEFGGAGLGISEATMMLQTISQSGAGMAGAQSIHANVYAVSRYFPPESRTFACSHLSDTTFGQIREQRTARIDNSKDHQWHLASMLWSDRAQQRAGHTAITHLRNA